MLSTKTISFGKDNEMSATAKGNVSLSEFCRAVYGAVHQEPFATRFANLSACGNRRGMIEMLMKTPRVAELRLEDLYQGKNDRQAAVLYEESLRAAAEHGDEGAEGNGRRDILTKALFAASANSRAFLDALCERARRSYNLRAFASCLRDCECMLALPANFFDDSAENVKYFVQRRKGCIQLERECSRKLEAAQLKGRGNRRKASSTRGSSVPSSALLGKPAVKTTPSVDDKSHSCLESCSDGVALQSDDTKGRHLVATRDIKPGTVLIVDQPFSYSTDPLALSRNCLHCHGTLELEDSVKIPCRYCQTVSFCTESCRERAWETYHKYECSIFHYFLESFSSDESQQKSLLLLAYRTTIVQAMSVNTPKQKGDDDTQCALNVDFLRYHTDDNDDIDEKRTELGSKKIYNPRDYRTVYQLQTHCTNVEPNVNLIRAIEAVFLTKCLTYVLSKLDVICTKETFLSLAMAMLRHLQAIICNAYEIVENVYDERTHIWNPRNIGGAIYTTVSLVNHSCHPNVVRHCYPNGIVVVRALRFIGKGCEILDCYGPQFISEGKLARREFLWKKYRFLCACDACAQNWKYPPEAGMRYKCTVCKKSTGISVNDADVARDTVTDLCANCGRTINFKKIERQLHKSIEKRSHAIAKMYEGNYTDALPLLFEHAQFLSKHLAEPNVEGTKTEQCIIQCYNSFGSTSV